MIEPAKEGWAEGRLGRLLDRLPEAVLVLDTELRLTYANAFALDVLGLTLDEAAGADLWILLPHLRDTEAPRELRSAFESGEERRFSYRSTLTGRWLEARVFREGDEVVLHTTDLSAAKMAEASLRRVQESLGLAMRGSRMGWWRRDLMTGEVVWSPELEEIFGLSAGSFDGTRESFVDFVHPDERARLSDAVEQALSQGKDYAVEFRFRRADGSEGWMEGRGKAVYEEGKPVASYGIGVDITERKRVEDALRRSAETFESLVQNSPFGIYVVDADFRLALVSHGAQKVFANVRPLLGRDFAEVLRTIWEEPFASEAIGIFRNALETGDTYHSPRTVETRNDVEDVESYDWRVERISMPDGRFAVVCNFYDLSERLRYEAALREANESLERRVEERTEGLTRANRDLDQFAYSVAHDLRAPLRNVVSTSRMLLEDASGRLTPGEADLLRRQAASGVRLARIVDDLLGFARLAQAEPMKAPIDVTALARLSADHVRGVRDSSCEVLVQEGLVALGDSSLVSYALTNLLDNALKFSPKGGQITVGQEGGAFFVRDEGVGFDMAHAGKLFVAFERLVGQDQFEGTGVGLANVRRIVEKHGGRVWAESAPGMGATFWFSLD